jgi:cytochrome c peroxidase
MRKIYLAVILLVAACVTCISFTNKTSSDAYAACYANRLALFRKHQGQLLQAIQGTDLHSEAGIEKVKAQIVLARQEMKGMDFWMRYLEPIAYKKVNGPLPVEWETEVFEKFEKPYKREGAGLTLAELYLDEEDCSKDSLQNLIHASLTACETYAADSITEQLSSHHHFYLANRLFLLNLAAIYTTGFECPDTARIIPELVNMLQATGSIYKTFNESFAEQQLSPAYLGLYQNAIAFVQSQPQAYTAFDHFTFIKEYVNPLYAINQTLIKQYRVYSKSYVDYTLNKNNYSIFNKTLYNGQNPKGIFLRVDDSTELAEINRVGKLLFYDPILSGNNLRSCNSCHKSTEYFTDTAIATSLQFDGKSQLARNTPSLIGAKFNHLLMLDGKHYTLQAQLKDVLFNPTEMGSVDKEVLKKVLSCKEYKQAFTRLLKLTPQEKEITLDHVASAVTYYYSKFSDYYAPFDDAMNGIVAINANAKQGFNLFMSKAQCATCHFVPNFNGVKPPYVGSEFEVLGVPADKQYTKLSGDKGRWELNNATETDHAIRTGSVRNAAHTAPYMHNGVFTTLSEVIDFYDGGGGAGHHLNVPNQTLSSDSLHLTPQDKNLLIHFIQSLDEKIEFEAPPTKLPQSSIATLNRRKVGGIQ